MQFDYCLPLLHRRNDSDHRGIQVTDIQAVPSQSRGIAKTFRQPLREGSHAVGCYHQEQPHSNTYWTYLKFPEAKCHWHVLSCAALENKKPTMFPQKAKATTKWVCLKAAVSVRQKTNLLLTKIKGEQTVKVLPGIFSMADTKTASSWLQYLATDLSCLTVRAVWTAIWVRPKVPALQQQPQVGVLGTVRTGQARLCDAPSSAQQAPTLHLFSAEGDR